ncbi:MAG TPA: hypothetical protein VI215_09335 [Bacteroidota bacterium]
MDRPGFPASILVAFFFVLLLSPACEQGLSPESLQHPTSRYGIKGTVHFRNWPPQDSIVDLRVVSFKHLPSQNILDEVLQGRAGFTPRLQPYGADSIAYTLILSPIPAGAFAYTAVAQQFGQNVNTDWRAVGLYRTGGDTSGPGSITVPEDSIVSGIDIDVDFQHPPPPPRR